MIDAEMADGTHAIDLSGTTTLITEVEGATGGSAEAIDLPATAARIKAFWHRTAHGVMEVGRDLNRVRLWVDKGEFTEWVRKELPFTLRTAERLMKVAKHPVLTDPTHVSGLPASWATIEALARLPEEVLRKAIADGRVHPKMERQDVAALDPNKKKGKKRSLRQEQEAAERILRAALAALKKLEGVNTRHIDPGRVAGWVDELGSAVVKVEQFCEALETQVPTCEVHPPTELSL
jgi:hypothetical protein